MTSRPRPVVVTGMHRTGTSMVANALRLGGLWLGSEEVLKDPAPDNPEGFFEHARIVELNDDLLEATGGAWDCPPAVGPLASDDPRVARYTGEARQVLADLAAVEPWGWKDPRTCLTARFWFDLVPELLFVLCVRHPLDVALSLKRRNQVSYSLGLSLWHDYYRALLDVVPEERRLVTHYETYFRDSRQEVARLLSFAGLPSDHAAAARSVLKDPLRHHRLGVSLASAGVGPVTIELYGQLNVEGGQTAEGDSYPPTAVSVQRAVIDLAVAKDQGERLGHQVASLEDEREELRARVDGLEAGGASVALAEVRGRLLAIEDAVHDLRYRVDGRATGDAHVINACREAVRGLVPLDAPVLVVGKDDPALMDLYGRTATNFPQDDKGRYPGFSFGHSQSAIAHLEALRLARQRFVLVPPSSRWWLDHYAAFGEHLLTRYPVVASGSNFGLLVDVTSRRSAIDGWPVGVSATIDRIATATGGAPAILDCSNADMTAKLPEHRVFGPPDDRSALPYLDDSVEVVLVEGEQLLEEARRVASAAVVVLRRTAGGRPEVEAVEVVRNWPAPADRQLRVVVIAAPGERLAKAWLDAVEEALAEEPAASLVVVDDPGVIPTLASAADAIALIDEGVLPLPGCFVAADATLTREHACAAVAVKMFAADGALEAAGAVVFSDGSHACVAVGSFDPVAPWHDYVRPTCWSPGLMLFDAAALGAVASEELPAAVAGKQAVWASRLVSAGLRVVYQPDAAAVRAWPGPTLDDPAITGAWAALSDRPLRPPVLDEAAWWELLVKEELGARP